MKKLIKRAALAFAVKEIAETVIEMRRPKKPSLASRAVRLGLVAGVAGAGFYLYKSGALAQVIGRGDSDEFAPRATSGSPEFTYRSEDQPVSAPA